VIRRRRMLSILAGGAVLPVTGALANSSIGRWRGIALGASAQIILDHPRAPDLIAGAVREISRLENIFSLYLANSELSVLNREGVLEQPAFEMVQLLSLCADLHRRTGGAFDPSVQALWALYAQKFSAGGTPGMAEISRAKTLTGWPLVEVSSLRIGFARPGVALTLNGVAQGFIADRIADFFTSEGVENVLINTGEIVGLGLDGQNRPWPVKLEGKREREIALNNQAIATSAPLGTVFDTAGEVGHIIDPRTGYPASLWSSVSVIADRAALADGYGVLFDERAADSQSPGRRTGHVELEPFRF